MPWNKDSDTGATFPLLMRVAALPGAQADDVNLIAGFVWRLSLLSSMHLQDYMVDAGTVAMIGGPSTERLVKIACKVGLLTRCRVDGFVSYKIVDDPDFINMRLKAEIEWDRQQRADKANTALIAKVRHRDGDNCRYCGVMVMWTGRPGNRAGTYDHLDPGKAATFETLVVACLHCNSHWRDIHGDDRADDLRAPPALPRYKRATAVWLNQNGYHVQSTEKADGKKPKNKIKKEKRPASQADTAPPPHDTTAPRQRPGNQPDTASTPPGDSDPAATAGSRAPGDAHDQANAPPSTHDRESGVSQDFGMSSVGSGRVGSSSARESPQTDSSMPARTRRRRSRRGKGPRDNPS